ncbi:hypothetical protein FHS99_001132 [Sphingomonas prati]|uniref:Uncharacterized protein n=1 Tax=Sphingomonas prati TaxID=1843237 RepID=A0A7W9BR86_9SPHN|nr:hypothetical protein [Sphingomonas prati]
MILGFCGRRELMGPAYGAERLQANNRHVTKVHAAVWVEWFRGRHAAVLSGHNRG